MGNELFMQYNIEKNPFLSGGHLNLWKIYKGTHKERKQDVCVFVFEKKLLEKYQREERDEILNTLKKEASALMKYKHPSILGIVEPLIEDKASLGFVTEPFNYTLNSWCESMGPSKLEIKLMITELCKVINFLHDDAHVIHSNLSPDVIFIDKDNKIKLSGLCFAINDPPLTGGNITLQIPSIFNLKYTPPEIVFDSKAFYTSDVYSLGLIIYCLLKYHKGDRDRDLIGISLNRVDDYRREVGNVENKLNRMSFDSEDNTIIAKCLIRDHSLRPSIKELIEQGWFNDPKLKAMCFIENLAANDMNKNVEFLNKFPKIVGMFENKLIVKRFLPCLLGALKNEMLINSVLPCIFAIAEMENLKINFASSIWGSLKELFHMKSIPAASLFFLLSKIRFIADKISNSEFSSNFLNIICKALDCNHAKIQGIVVKNLDIITKKIDSLTFKNQIYPRIIQIILNTNSVPFKVELLGALKKLYPLLDQTLINDSLLNNLEKIRKGDNSSEVCVAISGIYEDIAKVVNIESIANKILPNLISILVGGRISRSNFDTLMNLVHTYLDRIRKYREKDLVDDTPKVGGITGTDFTSGQTKPDTSSKPSNSDDFLSSFFGNDAKSAAPSNSNQQNFSSGGFDFTAGNSNSTQPTGGMFDGLMKPSTTTSNTNATGAGLFDFSNPSSSNKPTTSTNDFNSMNIDLFSNLSLNPSSSSTNTGFTNNNNAMIMGMSFNNPTINKTNSIGGMKRDDMLNNLMNDLPSSQNSIKTTSTLGSGMATFGSPSASSGFNENSLDFLGGNSGIKPQSSNSVNTGGFNFDFTSGSKPQPAGSTMSFGFNQNNQGGGFGFNQGVGPTFDFTQPQNKNNDLFANMTIPQNKGNQNQNNIFNF